MPTADVDAERVRRLVEALRAQGALTDAQLAQASAHFSGGHSPEQCLVLAGVPADVVERARASLEPVRTMRLGSIGEAPVTGPHDKQLGRWRLERVLGEGGMAVVWRAQDGAGQLAAIKLVHEHLLSVDEARARFAREIEATGKVRHPNVVEVLEVAPADAARAWFAVELVEGGDVRGLLARHGRLPLAAALEVFAQLLDGLEAAHALKVVHRDLKPDNLLLTREGVVKIADFGIARELDATAMTQTGSTLGTPAYMSPEQARAEPVDPRSDLYTAGVILYELLVGKNPFDAGSLGATIGNILRANAPPLFEVDPTIPEPIDELVSALMRTDPAARLSSIAAVRAAIQPFFDAWRAQHPRLLQELIAAPTTAETLRREQAHSLIIAARQLLQMGAAQREAAGLCLLRARLLDESNAEADKLLAGLAAQGVAFSVGASANAKILEVERQLAAAPDDPVLLQRAGQLWRQEGNVYKAAVYFRRYLRVRPDDTYVQGQLSRITQYAGSTVERIAGHVQTSLGVSPAPMEKKPMTVHVRAPQAEQEVAQSTSEALRGTWRMHGGKLTAVALVLLVAVFGLGATKRALTRRSTAEGSVVGAAVRPGAPDEAAAEKRAATMQAAFDAGRWDEAAREASAVLDHTEKPWRASRALVIRARARLSQNKPLSAVEDLTRVVDAYRAEDAYAEALVRRGVAYAAAGEADRAAQDFDRALAESLPQPLVALAHLERGLLRAQRGDVAGARKDLGRAEMLTPPGDAVHGRALTGLEALPAQ